MDRATRIAEPEIGTGGSSHTQQNLQIDRYRSGFRLPRSIALSFWPDQKPNRPIVAFPIWTAAWLPGPAANTWLNVISCVTAHNLATDHAKKHSSTGSSDNYFRHTHIQSSLSPCNNATMGRVKCRDAATERENQICEALHIVLPTGPSNPAALQVRTVQMHPFSSRPVPNPSPLPLGGANPDPYPSTQGFCWV